jgi:SAM-dependent methyltransferase
MVDPSQGVNSRFDQDYFSSEAYSEVSFEPYSQYWWSNRYYASLIRKFGSKSGRILEIGCGLGHLLGWLADRFKLYGTDINPWALAEASKNVPEANLLLLSAEDLGVFPDEIFQVVVAKHVFEHLPDPDLSIAEISRVLVPGGMLLLATPNTSSIARSVKKGKWIGYKDPTHISLWSPEQWISTLNRNQLKSRKIYSDGLWDAPYIPWLPTSIQKVLFGTPGGLQAIFGLTVIPLRLGESLIVLAEKDGR